MSQLDKCIKKAGKALSSRDAIAIRKYRAENGGDELAAVQAFAADLDGQLDEIVGIAEEQGAKVGRQDAGVNFEVAPDPDNKALAAEFNNLNPAQRRQVTSSLVNEFLPEIMIDLGITNWSYSETQGGFGNDVNPSIDLTVPDANMEQLVEIGDVVGYVASQQSIIAYDEHSSGTENDTMFVKLAPVTDMSYNEQAELYRVLHEADPELIQGFSWRDGAMVLGNFTEFSDEQFYARIEELIKPLDVVLNMTDSVFESRYENVTLEGTRYGNRDTNKSEAGRDVRGERQGSEDPAGVEDLKQRATERLRSEISRANPDRRAFRGFPPPGVREDGRVVLTHYSPKKELNTIDPDRAGEGASGKEISRKTDPGYLNKSYYGLEGYQKERRTGTIKYTLSMDANDIYNLAEDPMGFKAIAENEPYSSTFLENLIKDAGFEGYWKQAQFGPTVALFNIQTPENMTDETGKVFYQEDSGRYKEGEGTTRGYYNPDKTMIRLTEASNASTFLHEFAHFMLDMERKSNSPRIKEINKWFLNNALTITQEANGYLDDKSKVFKQPAFHGSPHEFREFLSDHIGTGEGAQVFGYGLYFAENPEVANVYTNKFYDNQEELIRLYNEAIEIQDYDSALVYESAMLHETPAAQRMRFIESGEYPDKSIATMADAITRVERLEGGGGNLYEVDIDEATVAKMLDWDKPLSEQLDILSDDILSVVGLHPTDREATGARLGYVNEKLSMTGEHLYGKFVSELGSDKAASMFLSQMGIPGNKYLDAVSRRLKDGTQNFVVFPGHEAAISPISRNGILFQGKDSTPTDGPISEAQVAAYLRNGTTGIEEVDVAIERATHEQFARGFEAYVMEGKAPSTALRKAFRVFARLMMNVYRSLKGDLNVKLDDDVRQVFDKLLAVDEAVEAATARARYTPLFTDAAMAGMTDKQFAKYKARLENPTDKAVETLREQVLKELTRVREQWWNKEKADIIDEEFARLKTEPVYLARERLRAGNDVKMDRASAKELLGVTAVPPPLRNMTVTGGEGTHPDNAAMTYGFNSGQEMLEALNTAPKQIDQATENAEAEMLNRHGDIFNDGSLETQADEAVRNEERGQMILDELKTLAKGTRVPTIDKATLKDLAEQHIGKMSLSEIRPDKYRRAEIRSAQEAALAVSKGEQDVALRAKTQQAMNFYLWKAAMDAREFGEKMTTFTARYQKKALRQRLGKAGNGYLGQIDKLLARFEFHRSMSMKKLGEQNEALAVWIAARSVETEVIAASDVALNETYMVHWKKIPLDEMKGIKDTLVSIEHNARASSMVQLGEEELEHEQAINRMLTSMSEVKDRHSVHMIDAVEPAEVSGRALKTLRQGHAMLVKIPWMMRALDNNKAIGVMYRAIMTPVNKAFDAEMNLFNRIGKPIVDMMESRSPETLKRHMRKYFIPEIVQDPTEDMIEGNSGLLYGHQILAVALNTGNEGNLRKMLVGEGWAGKDEAISKDNPKLQAILKHLTKEDWDLVQLMWDQIDLLKVDLAEVHERATGLPMASVEATPVETPFGTYRGGYYPLVYDAGRSKIARVHEDQADVEALSMLNSSGFVSPQVSTGARVARTDFTAPIKFSMDVIPNHISEVIHFITHFDAVRQVNKLISDPRIESAIMRKVGVDQQLQVKRWLNAVAKNGKESEAKRLDEKVADRLRFGTTYGIMGFKASTGLIQVAGLFNSAVEVGSARLLRSIRNVLFSEQSIGGSLEFAQERSKIMNHRMSTMDREIKNASTNMMRHPSTLDPIKRVSMFHIALIQTYVVDLPTWHAAYDKGMTDFEGDEIKAAEYADFAVEQIQGSGNLKDMSQLAMSNNAYVRLLTMFMTFFNAAYNHAAHVGRLVRDDQISKSQAIAKLAMLWMMNSLFETVMREGFGDDGDEEALYERVITGTVMMPFASVPFINNVVNGSISGYGYNASPVGQIIGGGSESAYKIITSAFGSDKEVTTAQIKNASKLAFAFAGVPGVNQAWISGEHLYDVMENGEEFSLRYLLVTTNKDK